MLIAIAREGGIWSQDSNTVYYDPANMVIRQSYGAWAYDTTNDDLIFFGPAGGPGDRHFEYAGPSTKDIIFTGVN